ncbi:MAG: LysR family transcriptional regulator [Oscillospiraceae bacterium]|nr:LysR family transcriptional regulator [Oscillospiraceae bacterium]
MDLKYLHTFRVIVDEGSFSRAAEKLNYTQSTITFQIGQLERELNTELFEKIGRRIALTKAGEQLLPYVDDVLNSVDRLRFGAGDISQCCGEVRVGVAETQLCYRLPPILREFHRQAPNARLLLRSMSCCDIRNELISGGLDIGIFYNIVGGFGASLTAYPFDECPLALVASPEVKAQFPDFITPERKMAVPFIINEPSCVFRQIFERYLREKSILLDQTIELWSVPTIKNLVINNMGVTFLPRFTVEQELASGALTEIPTELEDTTITAVCAHHKNKWLSPLMQLLLNLCGCPAESE